MTKKLQDAVRKQKQSTKRHVPQIYGVLGIPIGGAKTVEVPNRNSYVYVRLRNNQSEVIQAFNNQVSPAYNLPVIVERRGGRYTVIEVDTQRYENNWNSFAPFLPRHGNTHSFDIESGGGGDIVWVHSRQFMPALVFPSGSLGGPNVIVSPYTLKNDDGSWKYIGNTGTQNLTPYNPASPTGAIMVLVYLDSSSGNPYILVGSGTVFAHSLTGTSQITPYIPSVSNPSTQIPLAAIRLVTGTSQISWDNIYDVRQFLHNVPTGTGGGTTITVWDEGIPLGTPSVLNFVGAGVTATISGSVVQVNIPGGGSTNLTGTSIGLPNAAVLTDSNGFLQAAPWLRWGTSNKQFLEFGADVVGKESNAGKIGYEAIGNGYLDIVGAGASAGNRWVRIFDNLKVDSLLQTNSLQVLGLLSHFPYLNATGTAVAPTNAPERTLVTGSFQFLGLDETNQSVRFSVQNLLDDTINHGWIPKSETWTYSSADDPVFQIFVSGNITANPDYKLGNKIRCENDGSTVYGFIVKVGSYDGGNDWTPVDIYCGTDYNFAAADITNPNISKIKSPDGFPLDPDKWTVSFSDTGNRQQATPTANTWYNISPLSLSIPIGDWRVYYECVGEIVATPVAAANYGYRTTLSTANNSESDAAFTTRKTSAIPAMTGAVDRTIFHREKPLILTTKTTYYLNIFTGATGATSIGIRGDDAATIVKCVCVYL